MSGSYWLMVIPHSGGLAPVPGVYRLLVNFVPISYDLSSHMEIYWCYII